MWFSTSWFVLTLPLPFLASRLCGSGGNTNGREEPCLERQLPSTERPWRRLTLAATLRSAAEELLHTSEGGPPPSVLHVVRLAVPFLLIWSTANYAYSRALMTIAATDVTAVFSATPAFVYLLSILVLG